MVLEVLANSLRPPEISNPNRPNPLSPLEDSQALPAEPCLQATQDHGLVLLLPGSSLRLHFFVDKRPWRQSITSPMAVPALDKSLPSGSPKRSQRHPGQARIHLGRGGFD